MKKFIKKVAIVCEVFLIPFTYLSAMWLGLLRKRKGWFKLNWKLLKSVEVIPIINHYYEPLISKKQLRYSLGQERNLPAIDFNICEQLEILKNFHWQDELMRIQKEPNKKNKEYYYHNGSYEAGDAEYLYSLIRLIKPKHIIEIGCGNSTLMSLKAIMKNKEEDNNYVCKLTCIEPYEQQWLEEIKTIEIVRKKVEEIEIDFFQQLESNDILFIDSSHVIRPQGDVLYEYEEIIPSLKKGVMIHIHDILSPKDYSEQWILEEIRLWNEQYLLEAFLAYNSNFKIIASLNYLKNNYWAEFSNSCPILREEKWQEPVAFWIKKIN